MSKDMRFIPNSLEECCQHTNTVKRLTEWGNWIERIGLTVCIIICVVGIIISILSASVAIDMDEGVGYALLVPLAITAGISFTEYCVYQATALIMYAFATIVANTTVTANIEVYKAAKEEGKLSGINNFVKTDKTSTDIKKDTDMVERAQVFMNYMGN